MDQETELALVVKAAVETVYAPILARLAAAEAQLAAQALEIKAATAGATAVGMLTADLGAMRERVAVVERTAGAPGPPGPPGPPGADGQAGADGKDGAPGLRYLGVHVDGKRYEPGDVVTAGGSAWHCQRETVARPGAGGGAGWVLMVKCGRDGRDVARDRP